ncbi:hypothetical protein [Burkholderia sp. JP2-270]|uniref:hypothetical protein n=1 Tax=Burkholderia sp. JP2-270 TaxID=2217913 RepID=UPI0013A6E754|nr:hypothetical protein [Burkholderia sp. JP2-270]
MQASFPPHCGSRAGSVFESGPDRAAATRIHRDSNKRIQEKEWRIKNQIEILKAKQNAISARQRSAREVQCRR